MDSNWVKVYTTENAFTAELLCQGLVNSGIPAVVINKQISPYNLGVLNIMVNAEDEETAKTYISENEI